MNQNERVILKRKFTAAEDEKIRRLVQQYGKDNWATIASEFENRNTRQVRERYFHYLAPYVRSDPWTAEEDRELAKRVKELGHKWKNMETYFPGRTDISIKNHYNAILRQKILPPTKPKHTTEIAVSIPRQQPPAPKPQQQPQPVKKESKNENEMIDLIFGKLNDYEIESAFFENASDWHVFTI